MAIKYKEMQRKVEEIHRAFNDNRSQSTELTTNNVVLANSKGPSVLSISLPTIRADLSSSSPGFIPTINPQEIKKEEVAGFKAKVCETCMGIVIETQYRVDVGAKSPKNSHICIVSKVPLKPYL
jgi:hypothetical protein